ncbi:hypothetical protein ST47_g1888 [Ascochyta rabiei]|uniref:Uncharacterized protein n=1 Tax=Didymella rabiei TaxID=5454 RepID=A0A163KEW7_DIDRA|nr:hypothetical protein ST47_g1888 [Ascochyta rabiei]
MAYEVEDEVDWSDGTLHELLPSSAEGPGDSVYVSPVMYEDDESDYLLKPQRNDHFEIALGTALSPGTLLF